MNRRQFFRTQPQSFLQQAAQVLGVEEEVREITQESALLRFARRAMATTFEVVLPFGTQAASDVAHVVLDAIDLLENQLSVYRPDSEISRLNRLAPFGPVEVEGKLFNLLTLAAQLTQETEGAFDISIGALIKAWGFYRRQGRVPTPEERAETLRCCGMDQVAFDSDKNQVKFLCPGLELNLGSIGKGYALDCAADLLHQRGITSALVHGGYSSIFALGSEPGSSRGWAVGLQHPVVPGKRLGVVWLRDRALGVSAATYQHLEYNGRKLGHILDPRSGWPAEGLLSAAVSAPSGAQADALATAFFILGVDKARAYCQAHSDIGAVLFPSQPGKRPVVLGCLDPIFQQV